MIAGPDVLLLAAVMGGIFGCFAHHMGTRSYRRLGAFLFVLWVTQSAAQQLYRGGVVKGGDFDELIFVAITRLVFAAFAMFVVWYCARRELRDVGG